MLGRNLEALVTRAQEIKEEWKDAYVSVEHYLLAFLDDMRFGQSALRSEGLTKEKLEQAIKDIRGTNRVTDQAQSPYLHPSGYHLLLSASRHLIHTSYNGQRACLLAAYNAVDHVYY